MAVTYENSIKRYRGLSTDQKPGVFPDARGEETQRPYEGSTFTEIDTGARFIFFSGQWTRQPQTLETLLLESIELQREILSVLKETKLGHELYQWEEQIAAFET